MSAAKSNTTPAPCWRARIGQPTTLGEFRRMTECFSDDAPLAVRNAPLPTLYYLSVDGWGHIEIEIPDIHANAEREPRAVASRAPCSCSASGYDPECKWEGHDRA